MSEIWINYGGTAIAVKSLCRIRRDGNKVLLISTDQNQGAAIARPSADDAALLYDNICAKLGAINASVEENHD